MLLDRQEIANGVSSMAITGSEGCPINMIGRRPGILSIKFRLREERKKVLGISSVKYHNIEDHETEMRRFCLIRNTLQHLQNEVREEKLARHHAKASNISPSYLSASRPRSPSPPCDMEVPDVLSAYGQLDSSPTTALSDDEDELPPCKRQRLFMDDDIKDKKENSYEDLLIDVVGENDDDCHVNDTKLIHREVYEDYTGEIISQTQVSSSHLQTQEDTTYSRNLGYNTTDLYSNTPSSFNYSLSTILNCNSNQNTCKSDLNNGRCLSLSGCFDWSTPHQHYPCSQSALLGNDLQSVVYQSLITSL